MNSEQAVNQTDKCFAKREKSIMDDKLSELSCPFTWGMQNTIDNRNTLLDSNEKRFERVVGIQEHFPEFVLIYHVLLACENVMSDDLPSATQSVSEAEKSLADIKKKKTLEDVENVLEHIFVATKCHVLQKQERAEEVGALLDEICDVADMDETELAMLSGCQCLAWSLYYATDNSRAIECAEEAIEHDPDNGKWHFLLGKSQRKLRRKHNSVGERPNQQEILTFSEAFRLSKNVLFGTFLAQTYRDSLKYDMANKIYKEVYDLQPTCCKVQLQLALAFIRAKQPKLAKNCLDYVAKEMPDSEIYEYHVGMYEEKFNNDLKAALFHYNSAVEKKYFVAEWPYIECRKQLEPDWDPLTYMNDLLAKYGKDIEGITQEINIRIGSYYIFEKYDVLSACIILSKAIGRAPNSSYSSSIFQQHDVLFHGFRVNLYQVLAKEIQFSLENFTAIHDEETIAILENTSGLCRKHCRNTHTTSMPLDQASDSRFRTRSQTYDQSFSACREPKRGDSLERLISKICRSLHKHPPQKGNRMKYHSLNIFKDDKDSASINHRRIQETKSVKPLDKDCEDSTPTYPSYSLQIPSLLTNLRPARGSNELQWPDKSRYEKRSESVGGIRKIKSSKSLARNLEDLAPSASSPSTQIPYLLANLPPKDGNIKQLPKRVRDRRDSASTDPGSSRDRIIRNYNCSEPLDKADNNAPSSTLASVAQIPSLMANFIPKGRGINHNLPKTSNDEQKESASMNRVRNKSQRVQPVKFSKPIGQESKDLAKSSAPQSKYRNNILGISSPAGITVGGERTNSFAQSTAKNHPQRNDRGLQNRFSGCLRSSRERNNRPRASADQTARGNRDANHSSNRFRRGKHTESLPGGAGGNGSRQTALSYPSDKNDDNETSASCCLVKTLRNVNL